MKTQGKKGHAHEEAITVNTVISNFYSPILWENKFLLFKSPNLQYFVMAVWQTSITILKRKEIFPNV